MLKTFEFTTQPGKGIFWFGSDNKARWDGNKLDGSELNRNEIDNAKVDGGEVDDEIGKKDQKTSKFKKKLGSDLLILKAKVAFTKLRQAFVKAPILYHFDPKRHIWVETDVSGYAIGGVLSQLTLDDLGQ